MMDADLLKDEHAAISALFEFAEQQNYTTSENRPCFRKPASETSELIRWVKQQDVQWAAFTLKFPRFHNRMVWERALTDFFWELENRYPKSSVKKHRKKSGVPVLHRIAFMGGDKAAGIALHAQGMVEIQERGIDRLGEEMEGIWRSVVKRHSDSFCRAGHERHNESAWLPDAKVWVKEWRSDDDSAAAYLVYLARNEQFDFGIGASKVVLSATSLKPIRS